MLRFGVHYRIQSLRLCEADRIIPILQLRKLRLSKKIHITSRVTFLINDGIGIRSQLCPHPSELGLIIQNSWLDAWPVGPANQSCGDGLEAALTSGHTYTLAPQGIPPAA